MQALKGLEVLLFIINLGKIMDRIFLWRSLLFAGF